MGGSVLHNQGLESSQANHPWSYTGWGNDDIGATFLQQFLSYMTRSSTTFEVSFAASYNWVHSQWTVPLNASISQLVKMGRQPVQFLVGAKYFTEGPSGGPERVPRFGMNFLFTK